MANDYVNSIITKHQLSYIDGNIIEQAAPKAPPNNPNNPKMFVLPIKTFVAFVLRMTREIFRPAKKETSKTAKTFKGPAISQAILTWFIKTFHKRLGSLPIAIIEINTGRLLRIK